MGRKKAVQSKVPIAQETIDGCVAKAVGEGDIVNFRFLFISYSPLRQESSEDIEALKYAYLVPGEVTDGAYDAALAVARTPEIQAHIHAQLDKDGPAQLPSALVLMLADNAVRLEKYSAAGQAYELLRVRRSMQEEFFRQADEALDGDDLARGVRGYRIAVGLDYDYAAFPEPLPSVANHQTEALLLHAVYPARPEDCFALQPAELHVNRALEYLLDREAAGRLASRSLEDRVAFLEAVVRALDPAWVGFVERFLEARGLTEGVSAAVARANEGAEKNLEEEIKGQIDEAEFRKIPECLLGRAMGEAEWWQYVKELAYEHPAGILFLKRQVVSEGLEIIIPVLPEASPLAERLGLAHAGS